MRRIAVLGTDPLYVDSDFDGLTDVEEVVYFNSDPCDPDYPVTQ